VPDRGVLYLAPPLDHTSANIRAILRAMRLPFTETVGNVLAIRVPPGELRRLCGSFSDKLSQATLLDTKSLLAQSTKTPTLADLVQMQPLATLVGQMRAEWLIDMLREDRLLVHFQPIVRCAAPDEVVGHECLLRGLERDGTLIHHVHMARAAADAGLRYQLDRAARIAAVRSAAAHELQGLVTVNVDPGAVYDPAFCLQSTVRAVADAAIAPGRIALEVAADAITGDIAHAQEIAAAAHRAGFQLALDGVGSGHGSFSLVSRLHPEYVKIGIDLVRAAPRDAYAAGIAEKIVELAHGSDAQVVATGVETQAEWDWFRSRGVDCAQGYLFARPASPPPDTGFSPC
jgi:EAL domain-containing protein (putative c-di-GMP-specific phosphodiesterase class I)